MGKYAEIFNYFKKCPELQNLWCIGATEDAGVNVILPQGASIKAQYQVEPDVTGAYECEAIPYSSYYEDFQINCYRIYDSKDGTSPESNLNVLTLEEVQGICDWIEAQNEAENFPKISGKPVFAVECNPSVPQIRYVNPQDNTIAYFITVRLYFINTSGRRSYNVDTKG